MKIRLLGLVAIRCVLSAGLLGDSPQFSTFRGSNSIEATNEPKKQEQTEQNAKLLSPSCFQTYLTCLSSCQFSHVFTFFFFWNEGSTCCANARVCGHGVVPEVVFLVDLVASLWWTKVEFIVSDHWRLVLLPQPLPTLPTLYGDGKMKLNCLRCLNRPPTSSIPMRHGHGIRKPGLRSKDLLLACETLWNSVKLCEMCSFAI